MTGRIHRARPRRDKHDVPSILDPVDLQATQMRKEQIKAAGTLARQRMMHNDPKDPAKSFLMMTE